MIMSLHYVVRDIYLYALDNVEGAIEVYKEALKLRWIVGNLMD
jgi:hypothetical protein